jgi:hypothetical protein
VFGWVQGALGRSCGRPGGRKMKHCRQGGGLEVMWAGCDMQNAVARVALVQQRHQSPAVPAAAAAAGFGASRTCHGY